MSGKAILFTHKATGQQTLVQSKNLARARGCMIRTQYAESVPSAGEALKLAQKGDVTVVFDDEDDNAGANSGADGSGNGQGAGTSSNDNAADAPGTST